MRIIGSILIVFAWVLMIFVVGAPIKRQIDEEKLGGIEVDDK